MVEIFKDFGAFQQGLGWNATPVEADAAKGLFSMIAVLSPSWLARMAAT